MLLASVLLAPQIRPRGTADVRVGHTDAPIDTSAHAPVEPASSTRLQAALAQMPLSFVENQGQVDNRVAYYVQGRDTTLYFKPHGVTFVLAEGRPNERMTDRMPWPALSSDQSKQDIRQRWAIELGFVGANPGVRPIGHDSATGIASYFKGPREQWKTGLPTYASVVYPQLWPGIDLLYAGTGSQLKYTFLLQPGADPSQIKLTYRGATNVTHNAAGQLEVTTPIGGFRDERPYVYQEVDGRRVDVEATYVLEADATSHTYTYGFRLGAYDTSRPLVLDPAVLVNAGYIGGSLIDFGRGIAVDGDGNIYVVGDTQSSEATFPETVGPDLSFNGGNTDAFVAKVSASGAELIYAGYIGGAGSEVGTGIAVDADGNAYVTGATDSLEATFPITVGPDLSFNGGAFMPEVSAGGDAFVAKVDATGTALLYAGYIGGAADEVGNGIAIDSDGNAYVTGWTDSAADSFPVNTGPDLTYSSTRDAFVAKVRADGTTLNYAGYIGGLGSDIGNGIAVDANANAYVVGQTFSDQTTFPIAGGPDLTYNDLGDAFVAKVQSNGTALSYAGYIGGGGFDEGFAIAVHGSEAYVTGRAESPDTSFPVAVGPDLSYNDGGDAFVAKVQGDGTALSYAGYIGGGGFDYGLGIAVDGAGSAYVTGMTFSDQTSFPAAGGPDSSFNGGNTDAFVAKVRPNGTALAYAGYIGGSADDFGGTAIAVDNAGNAYVAGTTQSSEASFPLAVGPDITYNGGITDAFVAKLAARHDLSLSQAESSDPVKVGKPLTYTLTIANIDTTGVTATGVILTDTLPTSVTFVSATTSQGNCSGTSTVICNLGSLANGATATIRLVVTPRQARTISNVVHVTAHDEDFNTTNNTATISTTVQSYIIYLPLIRR
jgi:uncharacterized repeat protein (TIGR01451 family)